MSSWKETLDREYRDTGAPMRVGQWVLLGIGGYLVYKLLGSVTKAVENVGEGLVKVSELLQFGTPDKLLKDLEMEYPRVIASGVQPTINPVQMSIMANNMERAFKENLTLTEDSAAILEIFGKIRNDADFIRLFLAFGVRSFMLVSRGTLMDWINRWEDDLKPDINRLLERNPGSQFRV